MNNLRDTLCPTFHLCKWFRSGCAEISIDVSNIVSKCHRVRTSNEIAHYPIARWSRDRASSSPTVEHRCCDTYISPIQSMVVCIDCGRIFPQLFQRNYGNPNGIAFRKKDTVTCIWNRQKKNNSCYYMHYVCYWTEWVPFNHWFVNKVGETLAGNRADEVNVVQSIQSIIIVLCLMSSTGSSVCYLFNWCVIVWPIEWFDKHCIPTANTHSR